MLSNAFGFSTLFLPNHNYYPRSIVCCTWAESMGIIDKILPSSDKEEFACNDCGNDFSMVVRPEETPTCPDCGSFDLDNG